VSKFRLATIAILAVFLLASVAGAGPLEKRHQIELKLGMWNQLENKSEVNIGTVSTTLASDGLLVGLSYGYWLKENLALNLGVEVMAVKFSNEVSVGQVSTETSEVVPILMGLKYYFANPASDESVRPFGKLSVGPFAGSQHSSEVGYGVTAETRSEVAFGGQLAAGVDFVLGHRILTGMALGYNLMADFDEPIGGSRNYSGPTFNFGFSVLLGGGVN
jgi:outer membrane protein W